MRSYALLGFILPTYALVAYQPCLTTTALPLITVVGGPDGYRSEYTRTYQEFCPSGLTKKTYTITETCSSIDCHAAPIETAPPPGFTHAVVKCSACGGQGTQVATLTFPTESIEAYSSCGYIVEPLDAAQATQAWVDQVNGPAAVETSYVSSDQGSNTGTGSLAPGSSEQNGSQPQVPSSQGTHQDQQHNGSLGDTGSEDAATEYTGSSDSNGASTDQVVDHVGGSSSAQVSNSGENANGSGSQGSGAGTIPQHGPSTPPSTNDGTGSNSQDSNVPVGSVAGPGAGPGGASVNDPEGGSNGTLANPPTIPSEGSSSSSDATSVDGEPKSKNNPSSPADTTSSGDTNGSPGDVSDSDVVSPPSPQNSSPSGDTSSPQSSSDVTDADRYNVPQTVGAAGINKVNVFTCALTSAASIIIIWLL
ncbi:uncharacterized protein B0J16DRAFT_394874 [Fusarium flagelliforme]|uniref:Uncharacterized protein n=1 Tax=Fusarium flagelliforme TaxID=2675880 RepID=A0A395MW49_9HYPO|nr:uncharacterized protein B0J16DRAFT_394874 [Fusarium flagelliforme]KAH7192846.1 hypothetical protein B0J16DRAFT_394874 [Fusarium flagelliforme]RFN52114.1 hypothetical protein FIE12Z_3666 [Fusarium flagelliforme]